MIILLCKGRATRRAHDCVRCSRLTWFLNLWLCFHFASAGFWMKTRWKQNRDNHKNRRKKRKMVTSEQRARTRIKYHLAVCLSRFTLCFVLLPNKQHNICVCICNKSQTDKILRATLNTPIWCLCRHRSNEFQTNLHHRHTNAHTIKWKRDWITMVTEVHAQYIRCI